MNKVKGKKSRRESVVTREIAGMELMKAHETLVEEVLGDVALLEIIECPKCNSAGELYSHGRTNNKPRVM